MPSSLSFLNSDSFQIYSRIVAKHCKSVAASIILSELINRYEYHLENDELTSHEKYGEGWFYFTIEKCEERTCLSRKEQDTALKILKENNLISVVCFGLPAKRYFKVNEEECLAVFGFSKKHSSLTEKGKLDCPKRANCTQEPIHIKETYEDNYITTSTTSTEDVVVDVVSRSYSKKKVDNSEDATKEAAISLQKFLANRVDRWGPGWNVPFSIIEILMKKYGIAYVNDQMQCMLAQQEQYLKDQDSNAKKKKTKPIEKPEIYLRIACEKNYAMVEMRRK